ncbi:MAG: hypothetical protein ACTSU5_15565 [Promethearchaeota archaeon]
MVVESVRIQLERVESDDYRPEDLLRCILGLNPLEINIFMAILEDFTEKENLGEFTREEDYGGLAVQEIARIIKKDRTTVQRGVKSLRELGLLYKEERSFKNHGGVRYHYKPATLASLKERLRENLDAWYGRMSQFVESFEKPRKGEK